MCRNGFFSRGLLRRNHLDPGLHAPAALHFALELLQMLRQAGDLQRAGLVKDELLAGFLLEPLDLAHRALGQPRHQIGAARLRGQPGRPRRGLRPERVLVQQGDLPAGLRQMERHTRSQCPRPDHHAFHRVDHPRLLDLNLPRARGTSAAPDTARPSPADRPSPDTSRLPAHRVPSA